MKKYLVLSFAFVCFYDTIFSQDTVIKYETVQLISPRVIELNGGARSNFGGKSRESIKIDLPENTVEWYYSFTTTSGSSGTKSLNLAIQLAAKLGTSTNPVGAALNATGLTDEVLKTIEIPAGSASVDIYLCNRGEIERFISKDDLSGGGYIGGVRGDGFKHIARAYQNRRCHIWNMVLRNKKSKHTRCSKSEY